MDKNNLFKTTSFYLAVFLIIKNITLKDVKKTDSRKSFFVFDDSEHVQELVRVFNFGNEQNEELKINFKKVEFTIKKLKQILYEDKE